MSEARIRKDVPSKSIFVEAEFGSEKDSYAIIEGVKTQIVNKLVAKYVEEFGDEIIASIDLETIKKKTNDTVTVEAIKNLVKG